MYLWSLPFLKRPSKLQLNGLRTWLARFWPCRNTTTRVDTQVVDHAAYYLPHAVHSGALLFHGYSSHLWLAFGRVNKQLRDKARRHVRQILKVFFLI